MRQLYSFMANDPFGFMLITIFVLIFGSMMYASSTLRVLVGGAVVIIGLFMGLVWAVGKLGKYLLAKSARKMVGNDA